MNTAARSRRVRRSPGVGQSAPCAAGTPGRAKKKLVLAGQLPRQDEPDEPVPRFIMWVPHMHDRMPVIGDDAPGAQVRGVSGERTRSRPVAGPDPGARLLRPRAYRAGNGMPSGDCIRSGDGSAKR